MGKQHGGALVYVIFAIVAVAAVGIGVSSIISNTLESNIANNGHQQSYYAALSGLNFAKSLTEEKLLEFDQKIITYGSESFVIKVGSKIDSQYPVEVIGTANRGAGLEANYLIGGINITPASSDNNNSTRPSASTKTISGKDVKVAGYVDGSVIAETSEVQGGSTITGSYVLTSKTQEMTITGGITVAKVSGSLLCSNHGVSISGGSSVVNGNIYSPGVGSGLGYITIDGGATINGNLYANGTITLNGGSKIYGQSHSQKDIQLLNAQVGTKKVSQNMLSNLTQTITGWSTIYTDINSQEGVNLGGITLYGDIHSTIAPSTTQWQTTWNGSWYADPKKPTEPQACESYDKFEAPEFTATEDHIIRGTETITAGTYYYKTLTTKNWPTICFDTSGGDINILVSSGVKIEADVYVKSTSTGKCKAFDISSSDAASAAPYVYLYSGGDFTLGGGVDWVGTVVAQGDIQPGGGSEIVGSLHSISGTINPNSSWYDIKVIGLHE